MSRKHGVGALWSLLLMLLFLLAACDSGNVGGSGNAGGNGASPGSTASVGQATTSSTHIASMPTATTPIVITPKATQKSGGDGPLVISSPTPVPGDNTGSQQVVLADRTLVISSATKQKVNANSLLITLVITVKNTSAKSIMNQSTFFQLMGAEGDTFSYQYNSSDNFYGPVAAQSTRTGTISFQIPAAAATNLRLLYHSEIATETTLVTLNVK